MSKGRAARPSRAIAWLDAAIGAVEPSVAACVRTGDLPRGGPPLWSRSRPRLSRRHTVIDSGVRREAR